MTFIGLLGFAVKCFNVLAWPLCSLGYPLCASISAIESNSSKDTQNLVTYWVSFSLISLFDHAFAKLLYWNPLWPYMKLLAICWLVMPHFDGSLYVYKHVVHPCVSETPGIVMKWFSSWKEIFLPKEDFLVVAERYIEENGAEALEKLIAKKAKCAKAKFDKKDVKAVNAMEKNTEQAKCAKAKFDKKDVKAVDAIEKNAEQPECKEPNIAEDEIKKVEVTEKKEPTAAKWVNIPEVSPSHTDNKVNTAAVSKEASAAVAATVKENKLPEMPTIKTVQNEWTCALCQVKASNETIFNAHLQGRKHRVKYEKLKVMEAAKNKESSASMTTNSDQPKVEPNKFVPPLWNNDAGITNQINSGEGNGII